jgi:ELP3 family radical SAM enzyme/protein acetyltransferase
MAASDIEDIRISQHKPQREFNITDYVIDLAKFDGTNWGIFNRSLLKKYKFSSTPTKLRIKKTYTDLVQCGRIEINKKLEEYITPQQALHSSGVMVVTIATKPDKFSCKFNCHYCPNEPGQPRSYLSDEPVLARAMECNFDTVKQFFERSKILYGTERKLDKLEVIVVGGTWSCYDKEYQHEFITDIYYAANIFVDMFDNKVPREKYDLQTEQKINETASCRIISITLETRPDMINASEIRRFREFGCTRVQLGIQHINDKILTQINRRCYYADTIRAIRLLKDNGFKVDIHIMPNLPGSCAAEDIRMFDEFNNNPDLQVDQWKIYPCTVVPFTEIKKWYEAGTYKPYDDATLMTVIRYALVNVKPYVRINRVIRDIPMSDIIAGVETDNVRDAIYREMASCGIYSQDIRYREIKAKDYDGTNIKLMIRKYIASHGTEYFISHESNDEKTIYSLLRLRINGIENMCVYDDLRNVTQFGVPEHSKLHKSCTSDTVGCATVPMIRELHVYGAMIPHNKPTDEVATQHRGLGKQLLQCAEDISRENGFGAIAVISGVGVKEYYRKLGYVITTEGGYLLKKFV